MISKIKRTILYLDDDVACLGLLQHILGEDYDVQTALTQVEARRLLSKNRFDVVISDQIMPDIKGTEFLREVAEQYPQSFRVLLTGASTVGNILHEVSTGIIDLFLTKPWTLQDMRKMLEVADMSHNWRGKERPPRSARNKARI